MDTVHNCIKYVIHIDPVSMDGRESLITISKFKDSGRPLCPSDGLSNYSPVLGGTTSVPVSIYTNYGQRKNSSACDV